MNLFQMLERSARSINGERPAVTFEGDERSFAALRDRSLRLARGLHGAGVQPGDRVAVLMGNRHEWPEVLFGIVESVIRWGNLVIAYSFVLVTDRYPPFSYN